ncbi:type II toxin-antitoxin system VapC family toxin [soil metagenome]
MIAVDTNVLVRILIDDDKQKQQTLLAREFAEKNICVFVAQLVQVELVWVLSSAYELEKAEIIGILKHLYENEAFVLQYEAHFVAGLQLHETTNVGFADCLIAIESNYANCDVITFDKKFAKLSRVNLLT